MAKVTVVFAVLLIALGLGGYQGTGKNDFSTLNPVWIGLVLGVFGVLAMSANEKRRKLFSHINSAIGVVGFLGSAIAALNMYGNARSEGMEPDHTVLGLKVALVFVLLIYVNLCVRSFMAARSAGKV
jgi:uncharacterized membrane protein